MTTIKFKHPRCKHGLIKRLNKCPDCKTIKTTKRVIKKKRIKRRSNGQFDYSTRVKVYNAMAIGMGVCLIVFSGFFYFLPPQTVQADFKSPESSLMTPGAGMIPTPTPDPIKDEIREVFGEYAEDALKIAECESRFNPKAYNDNRTWGGVGEDLGVFQVNNVYHPAHSKFLYDYKSNIAMAYKIFKDAGYSFQPWTCRWKVGL